MNRTIQVMKRTIIVVLAVIIGLPTLAAAQEAARELPPVSIPSDHWVYPLLDRMAADGLLDGVWMSGRRPMGATAIGAALDTAVARADADSPWAGTIDAARRWLHEEYGTREHRPARVTSVAEVRAGDGPRTPSAGARVGVDLVYQPWESVGVWAEPRIGATSAGLDVPFPRLGAAWRAGPFRIAGSYDTHRLGPGASGGTILHDEMGLGWIDIELAEPVILPWVLRYLGPFQISGSASRFAANELGPAVGFFSGEFRLQPHPRVTLGLFRTAVIAWERDGQTLNAWELYLILVGTRSGSEVNFDDQKASMTGSVRLDLLGVTVTPYFVWGWEDTWEIDEDPATILGVWVPALPVAGAPVGVRYEFTAFGDAGRIIWPWSDDWTWRDWYRKELVGRSPYSEFDELLGHPLGGYGTEHRLEADVPLPDRGVLARGALFTRDRIMGTSDSPGFGPPRTITYSNLLYDIMPGRSWGGTVQGTYTHGRLSVGVGATVELGDEGWSRVTSAVRFSWLLP